MKRAISTMILASILSSVIMAQTNPVLKPSPTPLPKTKPAPARILTNDDKIIAAGIFLGFPMGFTVKVNLAPTQAIEAKAAWDLIGSMISASNSPMFVLHANYVIWMKDVLVFAKTVDIPPFAGIGGEMHFINGGFIMGLHIPFGLMYRFPDFPLELSLEGNLGMGLYPATSLLYSGGLGIRFRF